MTKPKAPAKKPAKAKAIPDEYEIELEPGAWERFEKLVKSAAKMGPKPHAVGATGTQLRGMTKKTK